MKLIMFLAVPLIGLAFGAKAGNSSFDYGDIQTDTYSESCDRDPCSVARITNLQLLEEASDYSILKLTAVSGSRFWDATKVKWNHKPYSLYVTCSLKNPTVQIGDQFSSIPLHAGESIPDVLWLNTALYIKACHDFESDATEAMPDFGYSP